MSTIQEKLARATKGYQDALHALAAARREHEDGAGKAYALLFARQADLKAKIAEHEAVAAASEATFKRLFAKANHVVTKEVKTALFGKNDALAIAEELRIALAECEAEAIEPRIAASDAARRYEAAYGQACAASARMLVYQALAECGAAMARAVALAMHVPGEAAVEALTSDLAKHRTAFVWKELLDLAATLPEARRMPLVDELGVLDLGVFADRNFVSVSAASRMRKIQALEANASDAAKVVA